MKVHFFSVKLNLRIAFKLTLMVCSDDGSENPAELEAEMTNDASSGCKGTSNHPNVPNIVLFVWPA